MNEKQESVSYKRHLAKAVTWRIFSAIYTFAISILLTQSVEISTKIVTIDVLTKIFLYYAHERIWYRFKYGVNHESHS